MVSALEMTPPVEEELFAFPLSFGQRRLWFVDQLEPGNPAYNMPTARRLAGRLDTAALHRALEEIVRRHETLRTTFPVFDGEPVQAVSAAVDIALPVVDLGGIPAEAREAEAAARLAAEAVRPFDLARGPLWRALLLRLGAEEHILCFNLHHIIADGWSIGILVRETAILYGAFLKGEPSPLPELPIQYADFTIWQQEWLQGEILEAQLAYWRERLAGAAPVLELPTDRPHAVRPRRHGGRVDQWLPHELASAFHGLAVREDATLFMALLAVYQVLLRRSTGQDDITVGTPIAGRTQEETANLIGFFVNALPLRVDLAGDPVFRDLLGRVREVTIAAFSHQDVPFDRLVEELAPERNLAYTPLFQALLVLQNTAAEELRLSGLQLSYLDTGASAVKLDLTLNAFEDSEGLGLLLEYDLNLFDAATVRRLGQQVAALIRGIVAEPWRRVSELPLLPEAERHQLLAEWNDAPAEAPPFAAVHELFARQAERDPGAPALVFEGSVVSYGELRRDARRVAAHLRALGVRTEHRVGLCVEPTPEALAGLLGILQAGAAYVPLDPTYPAERLARMLADSGMEVLLTQERFREALAAHPVRLVALDGAAGLLATEPRAVPEPAPAHPAASVYIIYTSGSTGVPKGVVATHGGLAGFARAMAATLGLGPGDRMLQFASLSFDASAVQIFPALTSGAALVLHRNPRSLSPAEIVDLCRRAGVTVLDLPAALWRQWVAEVAASGGGGAVAAPVRMFLTGGETVPSAVLREWAGAAPPGAGFLSSYGPTEATVTTTAFQTTREKAGLLDLPEVPVGRPLAGARVYLLGRALEPVAIGVPGELFIGGPGVTRGYWRQPALTAERFLPDPFSFEPGARLYRTGDLVRRLADGSLRFLGRADHQVKLRGYRIELEEIEAAISRAGGVRDRAVLVRGQRLVAFVVPESPERFRAGELIAALQAALPDPMVPSLIVPLPELPLTPTGKVDRKALARMELEALDAREGLAGHTPPRGPVQEVLAGLFSGLLGVERVGAEADFFALGGHSLLATQLVARVRSAFAVELPLRAVFDAPTVAGLAERVERAWRLGGDGTEEIPPIVPTSREGALPLSFAQQRLWFLDRLEPGGSAYNIPSAVRLRGSLDPGALAATLSEIARRHEALRTTFRDGEDGPEQVIAPPAPVPLPFVDLRALPAAERSHEAARLTAAEAARPFDLIRGPLLRAALVALAADEHIFLITLHHIVSDGWSMGVLIQELGTLYGALSQGRPSPLPELPVQYADFARWQRRRLSGDALAAELAVWRERLAGAPALLELPTDRPRPAVQTWRGATRSFRLPAEPIRQLRALAHGQGATLFMGLLAAFQALLSRLTARTDLSLGTPIAGRQQRETEELIGFFINTLVLRADLSGDPAFPEILARAREVTLGAYAHQDLPFEQLVSEMQPERSLAHAPLFQVMLVLQNAPLGALRIPGLELEPLSVESGASKLDLTLSLLEDGDALEGGVEYNPDLFDGTTIQRLTSHFEVLLRAVAGGSGARLSELPLLTPPERHQLLAEWNATGTCLEGELVLHRRIEEQVARSPEAVAVEGEDAALTYAELNARANQLARFLRRSGVVSGAPVAVSAERSPEMVVGLLAILKAGGAYVPLDPSYPQERLAWMLADAFAEGAAPVLLTQERLADRFPAEVPRFLLDADAPSLAGEDPSDLAGGASPDDLAYIIYTSGSTGRPKGAMNTHRAICNRLLWMQEAYGLTPADRVLQKTPFSFDVSVWELFWPLLTGARLVLARPEGHKDPSYLVERIERTGVTTLHFVPSMLQAFVEAPGLERCGSLRRVIASGEALPRDLADRFAARLGAELHNLYGPTEAAVDVSWHACRPGETGSVPIGRPISNLTLCILDPGLEPVPAGVPGELFIGGLGLARGYLGRPGLTAERFVPHPFAGGAGERLYRTGDLARFRTDGEIEYLGRTDHQVKIRGFRIELGEIEAALAAHPAVREAVAVPWQDGGRTLLVAYVVGGAPDELRTFLRDRLPDYMVPALFVEMPTLPLSPNGKVDRRALPAPGAPARRTERTAPRSRAEELLAGIWREALRLGEVGVDDNFFELGGDSILSLQVISRAARHGLRLTPRQLFEHPTVAGLAALTAEAPAAAAPAETGPVTGPAPLTPIQRWFFDRELPDPGHFNQALLLAAEAPLDPARLERAVTAVLEHHDALRARFVRDADGWRQEIGAPGAPAPFTRIDLSALPEPRRAPALEEAATLLQASLSLSDGPLLRTALLTAGAGWEDRLLLIAHHLVVDGVSWRVLLEDLEAVYQSGPAADLPPRTTSFRLWAERLAEAARSASTAAQAEAWPSLDAPPRLPVDFDSGPDDSASTRAVDAELAAEETRALLQQVPRAYRTRIDDALLTALAEAFAAWTGDRRLWLDLEGHGREEIFPDLDLSRTVGWFTALYPVLLDLRGAAAPGAALKAVKERLRSVPQRGVPFGLLRSLGEGEAAARLRALPAPGVIFNYLGQLDQATGGLLRPARESSGPARSPRQPRSHLLEITAWVQEGRLRLRWDYSAHRHRRESIERLAGEFLTALRRLIQHCQEAGAGGFTPSDFPLARIDQAALDRLVAATPARIEDLFPASPMQQGMIFHSLRDPGSGVYVEQLRLRLGPDLDPEAFERAWPRVVDRHPALRTAFFWSGLERPLQVVGSGVRIPWERRRGGWSDLLAWQEEDRRRDFDLSRPPLARAVLFDLADAGAEEGYGFLWSYHHALLDGWSLPVLLRDLFALYQEEAGQGRTELDAVKPFRDYIAWLEGQDLAAAEAFWRRALAGFSAPTPLGIDRPAGSRAAAPGSHAARASLAPPATQGLRNLARSLGVTLNTVVQGAWALLLHRYSGEEDVVFGAVTGGRSAPLPGIESIVGLFINTLPARVRVERSALLGPWLRELQERQAEALQYEYSPLAEIRAWSEVPAGRPLFESLLAFENYPVDEAVQERAGQGLGLDDVEVTEQLDSPLSLLATPGGRLSLTLLHDPQRIEAPDAVRLLRHLEGLFEALPAGSDRTLGALPVLTPAERQELLADWNDTARATPWTGTAVHRLFEARVDRSPDAVALVFGGEPLTYRELDRRANRLAHRLRSLGIEAEARVGILLERSIDLVAGVLGVLKAGGAYVPLDPAYPAERLELMACDAGIRVLLTSASRAGDLPLADVTVLRVDADREAIAARSPERLEGICDPEQLAYVIYTSGSTGRPKGVQISHGALANFLASMAAQPGLEERDTLVAVTSLSFDIAGLEIYLPLLIGARLVLASREEATDGARLRDLLAASGATALQATPATWRLLLDAGWAGSPDLKALCGGEALPPALAAEIRRRTASLWNVYGPTETTIWSTLDPVEEGSVSIGRPIDNTQAYLLDRWGEPVPPGAPGELLLGGLGVARGYLGRPDLTAERFIPDPFGATPGARLYRTGDLVRCRPDGKLEFQGRADHQVKIRGFRIEPGEVEAVLESHPGVRETAVVAREDTPGDLRLVAYFVPREDAADEAGLRRFLEGRLPRHMVPALFVRLEELPRLPNGKLNRKALPALEARGRTAGTAPRTPLEELIAGLFTEVLRLEPGVEDSFFDLGGHSLSAVQLAARLHAALGVDLPVRTVFDTPTVAGLAGFAERALRAGGGDEVPRLERVPRGSGLPVSFAQQRLWFLDQMEPGSSAYNLFAAFRLHGPLDVPALRAAFDETVRRHEALRTTIGYAGGEPVQVIAPAAPVPLPWIDLGGLEASAALWEARRLAELEAGRSFDLERGPLLRQILVRLGDGEHAILLTMHHVISDGWSVELLVRELGILYGAFSRGLPSPLPELAIQYADFARWQRSWLAGAVLERQLGYWRGRLEGAPPVLALPTDRPRPAVQTFRGAARPVLIPAPLAAMLQAFARQRGATLFMTVMAAFQELLSRHAGQADISVGTPIAGRNHVETEALIGFFANTLVLRTDLAGDPDLPELVARVREGLLGAYAHQHLPFERLVEELQPERSLSWTPLFQVAFALQNTPLGAVEVPGLRLDPLTLESGTAKFDLTLLLSESGGGLAGVLEYNRDLFDGATVQRMVEHFLHLLAGAVAAPGLRLSDLPLLSLAELHQRLEWNDTAVDLPRNTTLPELFERQAEWAPERTALFFANRENSREMTYGELSRRARALAAHLRRLGIAEGALVGVCTEPSFETVVGLLGILRTGAAYVPLDPEYPRERLAAMLDDVPVLLTQARLVERLPATGARIVLLDEIALDGEDDAGPGPRPDSLAYIIYTSGSTGRPKGVMIDHRGAVNTLCDLNLRFGIGPEDRVLALSSLSFDLSVYDLFGLLAAGGAAVLAPAGARRDPALWVDLVGRHRITLWNTVPALMEMLVDEVERHPGTRPAGLRLVMMSGDWIPVTLPGRIRALWEDAEVISMGGATEASIWSILYPIRQVDPAWSSIPYGRPMWNQTFHVLDAALQPSPVRVPGQLYIGGAGVALGYWRDEEKTRASFVVHPRTGERLYRTGDLGRHLADGTIEFLGRADQQVKIRGFRIELGEIESVLSQHPEAGEALAIVREDRPGEKRLVAYVVPAPGGSPADSPAATDLRAWVAARLPEYMVPSAFVLLDTLPLTANGKVDRQALPAPEETAAAEDGWIAPRTPAEEMVAGVFADLLQIPRAGAEDSFFDLGGHSLLGTQLITRLRESFGVELPLRVIFERPTVRALSESLEALRSEEQGLGRPPLVRTPREGLLPLSFAQQRLWFLEQLQPGSPLYNLPSALRLAGPLDVAVLRRALDEIVRRHESLRTTFIAEHGLPAQVVAPPFALPLPVVDLSGLEEAVREAEERRLLADASRRPFDLARGPLLRVLLLREAADRHVLHLCMHHIVSDGWSMDVLVSEMSELFAAFSRGAGSPLPELPIQYPDFARWQRSWLQGEVLEAHIDHWKQRLDGAPPLLDLPFDHPRPAVPSFRAEEHRLEIPEELSREILALSRRQGATLFMTLLAAFQATLHSFTGVTDVVVGTDIANRNRAETERLIGFFIDQLVLRTDLGGDPDFLELLARVRQAALDAYAHQDLPFDKLVEILRPERSLHHHPIFQVKLILQNTPRSPLELPQGLTVTPLAGEVVPAREDLLLDAVDTGRGLTVTFKYNADLFEPETVSRIAEQLAAILRRVAGEPAVRLSELREELAAADRTARAREAREHQRLLGDKLKMRRRPPGGAPQIVEERSGS
jgi:amino acid adenylation domain-containing protein/non-ribosomal peptide synthase protein (TIGR01720 family)